MKSFVDRGSSRPECLGFELIENPQDLSRLLIAAALPIAARGFVGTIRKEGPLRVRPRVFPCGLHPLGRKYFKHRRFAPAPEVAGKDSGYGSIFEFAAGQLFE